MKYTSTFRLLSARLSRPRCRSTGNCLCPAGAPASILNETYDCSQFGIRKIRKGGGGIRNPADLTFRATVNPSCTQLSRLLCREKFTVDWKSIRFFLNFGRFLFSFFISLSLITCSYRIRKIISDISSVFFAFICWTIKANGTSFNYPGIINEYVSANRRDSSWNNFF